MTVLPNVLRFLHLFFTALRGTFDICQSRVSDSLLVSESVDRVVSLWFLSSTGKRHTVTARECGLHSVPLLWTPKLKISQDLPEFHSSYFKELKPKRQKLEILKINFQSVESWKIPFEFSGVLISVSVS